MWRFMTNQESATNPYPQLEESSPWSHLVSLRSVLVPSPYLCIGLPDGSVSWPKPCMCLDCSCPELTTALLHEVGAECLIVTPTQLSAGNISTGSKREFCYQMFRNRCHICTILKNSPFVLTYTTEESWFLWCSVYWLDNRMGITSL
jgi:hypothetical protein